MEEVWKPIYGFEEYEISNYGNVKKNNVSISLSINTDGYYFVTLFPGRKMICCHRLVGLMFLDNPNNYPMIDHIDRNIHNNNVSNLRWVTNAQNQWNSKSVANAKNIRLTTDGYYAVAYRYNGSRFRKSFKLEQDAIDYLESLKLIYPRTI